MLRAHPDTELQPFDKNLFILLQDEELSQHDVSLIKAKFAQPPTVRGSNPGHFSDVLIAHGLSDEGSVLLGSR